MMKNTYVVTMNDGTVREVEADAMTIESGHYVFRQAYVGPFRTIALSAASELSTLPNDVADPNPSGD